MRTLLLFLSIVLFLSCQNQDDDQPTIISPPAATDSLTVTVIDGLGGGIYEAGDTVWLFSRALAENEVFDSWSFDTPGIIFLQSPHEWFTRFIMPDESVIATAAFGTVPNDFLQFEEIQGENTLKPVYSAFPAEPKGTVFFFHGTSGSAEGWLGITNEQRYAVIKAAYLDGFGVIITESEESTLNQDLNNDGKLRWQTFPIDTLNNVDYLNLRVIMDEFTDRGLLNRNALYSIGMSNGGAFSAAFAGVFSAQAGIAYCASSAPSVANQTEAPTLFCLMPNDDIIDSNQEAIDNSNAIKNRGICSNYFMNSPFPVYPEYFTRIGLDSSTSVAILEELDENGMLDGNYFNPEVANLDAAVQNQSDNWPIILNHSIPEIAGIRNLIMLAYGGHVFYANHNRRSLDFLNAPCE